VDGERLLNLSDYIPESYIPATITASVAIIAAVGAQLLNNYLTHRRENKKYLKEVYEKFISEFFTDVITYAHISSLPRRAHDTKGEVEISSVLDDMFNKVHYGNKHLQSLHLQYKTLNYMEDFRGDAEVITHLKICYFFLLYCKEIFKKIGFKLEPNVKGQLLFDIRLFSYLYIYSETRDYDEARNNMTSIRMLHLSILEKYSLRYLHKLVTGFNTEENEKFLKEVDKKIQEALSD
jgi:hypothetical protein